MAQPINLSFGIDVTQALAGLEKISMQGQAHLNKFQAAMQTRNAAYSAGMAGMKTAADEGLNWIDARFEKSFKNQKTAIAGVADAMAGSLKSAASQALASGASFIAENLAVAGSFLVSAAASVLSSFAAIPFVGVALGAAAVAGLIADWNGIKKTLGFEKGGIGLVGENGPKFSRR